MTRVSINKATANSMLVACALAAFAVPALSACSGGPAPDLIIERMPDVTPSLPTVPTIPPPPYPVQHPDTSYSIYGVRRRMATTIDTDVVVTGYIVAAYVPPECPEDHTCPPPAAPHIWIADAMSIGEDGQRLMVVGYAENQAAIDEAVENARRGREQPPESETGIIPIPVDFGVGAKIKVRGRFARLSGAGFNNSEGLLEYRGHETLEPAPEVEAPARGR